MSHSRIATLLGVGATVVGASLSVWAGMAAAVSGGGYQPAQQGCQPTDADWATPNDVTYPGCHNLAVNVESGGTTGGNANAANTRYVSLGADQLPNDPKSTGTGGLFSIGLPGTTGSPHAGCAAINTDGTGGGPAPSGTPPQPLGQAENTPNGCGSNPRGTGVESNVDYYQYYCPIAKMLGYTCEDTSSGATTLTPVSGGQVALQPVLENGVLVYLGADDNTDNGEHDGLGPYTQLVNPKDLGAANGPSDGGGVTVSATPRHAAQLPTQSHPEGLANASFGACADGICLEGTTQQQTVYYGCGAAEAGRLVPCSAGTPQNANVYNYAPGGAPAHDPSVNTESAGCNSGDKNTTSAAQCGPGGMNAIRAATPAHENAQPGIQLYTDPDPQRSPAAPAPLWPTPAVYIGTCGVYLGSPATTGQVLGSKPLAVGGLSLTNSAGQIAIDPNPAIC